MPKIALIDCVKMPNPERSSGSIRFSSNKFSIIQNFQRFPIPQTRNWYSTFFVRTVF